MLTPETIAKKLAGSASERDELAVEILAIVDRAVFFTLRAWSQPTSDSEDLVEEVMVLLFRNDAKVLRGWDPNRAGSGAKLPGYLAMVARRDVQRRLKRRLALPLILSTGERVEERSGSDAEEAIGYAAALEEVYDWVQEHGTNIDRRRFSALFVDGHLPADVAAREGVSTEALYTWTLRFRRQLEQALPHVSELIGRRTRRRREK